MNIYILEGTPKKESYNTALADAYEEAAKAAGHSVRRQNLADITFNPILSGGYKSGQEIEPDLVAAQQNISWCNHWVIFYPVWWGAVPALLKGFIDRILLPGFAFKYHKNDPFWDRLLVGRSARIITTSDSPSWWLWLMYRDSDINMLHRACLDFCGIKPVKVTRIGGVRQMTDENRKDWIEKVKQLVP